MTSSKGLNVLGTQVPTDQLLLCRYDENKVMVASQRVRHIGRTRGRYFVMVADKLHCWSDRPQVWKQFRLNRIGAENLYPMTPELKAGQDLVERVLEDIHS